MYSQKGKHSAQHDLDDKEWFQLKMMAIQQRITIKELVSRILRNHLQQEQRLLNAQPDEDE